MEKLSRDELEQIALEVIPAGDYYELMDCIENVDDAELYKIINKYSD